MNISILTIIEKDVYVLETYDTLIYHNHFDAKEALQFALEFGAKLTGYVSITGLRCIKIEYPC